MRSKETTTPPRPGMQPPDSPVPDPRGVRGMPSATAALTRAATSSVVPGSDHGQGPDGRTPPECLVMAVLVSELVAEVDMLAAEQLEECLLDHDPGTSGGSVSRRDGTLTCVVITLLCHCTCHGSNGVGSALRGARPAGAIEICPPLQ